MPKKKDPTQESAEGAPQKETAPEGALVKTAKSVGEAAGKIAVAIGIAKPAKPRVMKLAKKNKSRLPRRQKKAANKAKTST